jgi:hypothetical protein
LFHIFSSGVVATGRWWRIIAVITVVSLAVFLGTATGSRRAPVGGNNPEKQELFNAVEQELAKYNLPKQDMPKEIISVQEIGQERYRVQMQMHVGIAWFEVWRENQQWQVRGIPAPP